MNRIFRVRVYWERINRRGTTYIEQETPPRITSIIQTKIGDAVVLKVWDVTEGVLVEVGS